MRKELTCIEKAPAQNRVSNLNIILNKNSKQIFVFFLNGQV